MTTILNDLYDGKDRNASQIYNHWYEYFAEMVNFIEGESIWSSERSDWYNPQLVSYRGSLNCVEGQLHQSGLSFYVEEGEVFLTETFSIIKGYAMDEDGRIDQLIRSDRSVWTRSLSDDFDVGGELYRYGDE